MSHKPHAQQEPTRSKPPTSGPAHQPSKSNLSAVERALLKAAKRLADHHPGARNETAYRLILGQLSGDQGMHHVTNVGDRQMASDQSL